LYATYSCLSARNNCEERKVVVVLGAGPIGLMMAIRAKLTKPRYRVIVVEQRDKKTFASRHQQLGLKTNETLKQLKKLKIDLDSLNLCYGQSEWAYIRISTLQLALYAKCKEVGVEFKFNAGDITDGMPVEPVGLMELNEIGEVHFLVICDGSRGLSAPRFLGKFIDSDCKGIGVVGILEKDEKAETCLVPPHVGKKELCLFVDKFAESQNFIAYRSGTVQSKTIGLGLKMFHRKYKSLSLPEIRELLANALCELTKSTTKERASADEIKVTQPFFEVSLLNRPRTARRWGRTIVTVEGDAARTPNFLSGSGINVSCQALPDFAELLQTENVCKKDAAGQRLHEELSTRGLEFLMCMT